MAAQASQAAFAGNDPSGQMGQGPAGQVGEHLLHLGMAAVVFLGREGGEGGVSKHGVVAPGAEQLTLALGGFVVEVFDPADDQPGSDCLPFFEVNAV